MLENGLKLIVQEDHRSPVVVTQVWYKVGASYEHEGITGLSHMLEHMMFKGTEDLAPGEFSRIIAENGGRENAFTGRDYTAYYQQLEKSRLPISFKLEADRMRNLIISDEEFLKERKVVTEERRMRTDDKPQALGYEKLMAAAHQTSPYRNPVIGWMADIENYEPQDMRDWYQMWYAPNNATVVVVGDVNPTEVHELAKKHFGPLKPETLAVLKARPEIPQTGEKRLVVYDNTQVPYMLMGYKVPSLVEAHFDPEISEKEIYALEVLSGVLDGGSSARLTKNLVRGQEIASSAGAGYSMLSRLQTLFLFDGMPAQGQSLENLEKAIRAEIEKVKNEPLDEKEMARVKTQVITSDVYEKDSVYYQAMIIGTLETVGLDWKLRDEYVEKVQAVTAEEVQAVAKKYLIDNHLTVEHLYPLPTASEKSDQITSVVNH
ncbi:MAG: M16 family metallopeptidase [Gammaproteobacteria bacterium]